jgi:hypothetical protein
LCRPEKRKPEDLDIIFAKLKVSVMLSVEWGYQIATT